VVLTHLKNKTGFPYQLDKSHHAHPGAKKYEIRRYGGLGNNAYFAP
jgi:hypothetical protein